MFEAFRQHAERKHLGLGKRLVATGAVGEHAGKLRHLSEPPTVALALRFYAELHAYPSTCRTCRERKDSTATLSRRLTSALSGPREAVPARRERKMIPHASGAPAATFHGPLERVVRWQFHRNLVPIAVPSDFSMSHSDNPAAVNPGGGLSPQRFT